MESLWGHSKLKRIAVKGRGDQILFSFRGNIVLKYFRQYLNASQSITLSISVIQVLLLLTE